MQDVCSHDCDAVLVAVGSNVANGGMLPIDVVKRAIARLSQEEAMPERVSRWYRTPAWPPGAGPDFVNGAVRLRFDGDAAALLALLHRIEAEFDRARGARWAARTLDLDLIAWGQAVLPDAATQARWAGLDPARQAAEAPADLIVPHPRLQDRPFVLIPLADVAPGWRHPATGDSVAEMVAALSPERRAEVRPI